MCPLVDLVSFSNVEIMFASHFPEADAGTTLFLYASRMHSKDCQSKLEHREQITTPNQSIFWPEQKQQTIYSLLSMFLLVAFIIFERKSCVYLFQCWMKSCCLLLIEEVNLSLTFAPLFNGLFGEIKLFFSLKLACLSLSLFFFILDMYLFLLNARTKGRCCFCYSSALGSF